MGCLEFWGGIKGINYHVVDWDFFLGGGGEVRKTFDLYWGWGDSSEVSSLSQMEMTIFLFFCLFEWLVGLRELPVFLRL